MTILQVMAEDGTVTRRTETASEIAGTLAGVGVHFEQWAANQELGPDAGQDEVLAAYREPVGRLVAAGGYPLVDVVRMRPVPGDPDWLVAAKAAREKFLDEHRHDEDEVRFFVEGRGCFYLHVDRPVYAVVCTAGDLLSVPAGTRHWFDMGAEPEFCAIRFFQRDDGWIGDFTGDPIARRLPSLDELVHPARDV